jgi:hypothetical protein
MLAGSTAGVARRTAAKFSMAGKSKALEKAASILRPQFYSRFASFMKDSSLAVATKVWHPSAVVHPTAVVDVESFLDEDVVIGPFCHVGKGVALGSGCKLLSHVSIHSNTVVGNQSVIHPFASVGADPQDLKYTHDMHSDSWLVLGQNNIVRENTSINRGTAGGGGTTSSGHSCLFMSLSHVSFSDFLVTASTEMSTRCFLLVDRTRLFAGEQCYYFNRKRAGWTCYCRRRHHNRRPLRSQAAGSHRPGRHGGRQECRAVRRAALHAGCGQPCLLPGPQPGRPAPARQQPRGDARPRRLVPRRLSPRIPRSAPAALDPRACTAGVRRGAGRRG